MLFFSPSIFRFNPIFKANWKKMLFYTFKRQNGFSKLTWIELCCQVCTLKHVSACTFQDTLRDCAHDNGTCYNTVVSPIYFVSFVLTAQFVLVNVVIAVLMKHLEESNKEAKEEAELEAEMELEAVGGDGGMTGGHISPLALRDIGGPAGSRWISRDSQDRGYLPDSPSAAIRRDSAAHRTDQPQGLEPPLEVSETSTVLRVGGFVSLCRQVIQ